jgi:hypothetical protein
LIGSGIAVKSTERSEVGKIRSTYFLKF